VGRVQRLAVVVFGALVLQTCSMRACQYNVREVGFIDMGIEPYRLLVHVPETASPDDATRLRDTLDVMMADTNIRCELVTPGADANLPVLPAGEGLLVSPDGQSRRLLLWTGDQSPGEAAPAAVDAAIRSTTSRQILEKAASCYGVVLLIEGPQAERNADAREAVSTAIAQIGERLEYLPKPIAKGPEMVVLDHASLAREELLLWTLGLTPEDVNEPHAAIFYGRGRWMGPLFLGEVLTAENLLRVLAIIGADCECGLDHRWLQGTMLPARWDEGLQHIVAENLGFDPESPMIKMEMVSIIRRGMGGVAYPGASLGYQEIVVGGDTTDLSAEPNGTTTASDTAPAAPAGGPSSPALATATEAKPAGMEFAVLAASLGGMAVVVAAVSTAVLLKAKKD